VLEAGAIEGDAFAREAGGGGGDRCERKLGGSKRRDGGGEKRRLDRGVIKNFSIIVAVCRNCRGKTRMGVGQYPLSTDMWA
jgi:hypothetical protein